MKGIIHCALVGVRSTELDTATPPIRGTACPAHG